MKFCNVFNVCVKMSGILRRKLAKCKPATKYIYIQTKSKFSTSCYSDSVKLMYELELNLNLIFQRIYGEKVQICTNLLQLQLQFTIIYS